MKNGLIVLVAALVLCNHNLLFSANQSPDQQELIDPDQLAAPSLSDSEKLATHVFGNQNLSENAVNAAAQLMHVMQHKGINPKETHSKRGGKRTATLSLVRRRPTTRDRLKAVIASRQANNQP